MTRELIDRFFREECTSEEAAEVAAYLKANPSVLEEYLSTEEWDTFKPGTPEVVDEFWNETWDNIRRTNRSRSVARKIRNAASVVAIMALVVTAIYYFIDSPKEIKTPVAQTPANKKSEPEYKIVRNDTKEIERITLDDSSVVELSPASFIQYETPFGKLKRDIQLEGRARFSVAKNKAKPFTVYTGTFSTTALGTVFTVQHNTAAKTLMVRLYEGKVVIHSMSNDVNEWQRDVYLQPGEQLEFNGFSGKLALIKTTTPVPAIAVKQEKHTVDSANNQLSFNNTSLAEVMHTLAGWYTVKIEYDSAKISKMNFTGMVSRNDSPETILKVIAQIYALEVSKNDTAFIINKP